MARKTEARTVINLKDLPFCAYYYYFSFAVSRWRVSSRVRGIIWFFFHACNASRWIQCLAIMTCYCISAYPPHLSTMGPRFFIILPLLAIAVFSCHTKEWVQDAVGFLLRGLSSLMYTLRHWERVFSRGKSLTSKHLCNRKPPCKRGAARKEGFHNIPMA